MTVIGGGLCGKAASLQLAQAGLRVICIEPEGRPIRPAVGESLDWSAPALLSDLGLPMEDLIAARMAGRIGTQHVVIGDKMIEAKIRNRFSVRAHTTGV